MTYYYSKISIAKSTGPYWSIGLRVNADSLLDAVQLFTVWTLGIKSTTTLKPYIEHVLTIPQGDKSYFNIRDYNEIYADLQSFLHEDENTP